jgi:hypothetical protein
MLVARFAVPRAARFAARTANHAGSLHVMDAAKCPSCGDVMHQHRLPVERPADGIPLSKPEQAERLPYRCGQCGCLYRHPPEK